MKHVENQVKAHLRAVEWRIQAQAGESGACARLASERAQRSGQEAEERVGRFPSGSRAREDESSTQRCQQGQSPRQWFLH